MRRHRTELAKLAISEYSTKPAQPLPPELISLCTQH